jgi:catechol 2,3-dioxygenase-like lactoylglutathione lyase family enzyme
VNVRTLSAARWSLEPQLQGSSQAAALYGSIEQALALGTSASVGQRSRAVRRAGRQIPRKRQRALESLGTAYLIFADREPRCGVESTTTRLYASHMAAKLSAVHPVLMVRDVRASIEFYGNLGFTTAFADSSANPKYAGIRRDSVELHLQWHDAGEWSHPVDRPTYRFLVDDVDGLFAELRRKVSAVDTKTVSDTPWGTREFHVRDPDLNGLQFYRAL